MSGTLLKLNNDYLDFFENAYSSVCKPMYCEFKDEPLVDPAPNYGFLFW